MNKDMYEMWAVIFAIAIGSFIFWAIVEHIEPWVIETTCRELLKCND